MKHAEFTTSKGDFLVIEDDRMDYDAIHDSKFKHQIYGLIGKVPDITEEQAKEVVDDPLIVGVGQYHKPEDTEGWFVSESPMGICYTKNTSVKYFDYMTDVFSKTYTAFQSLNSLLQANGVVFENPMGNEPAACDCLGGCSEEEQHGCLGDFSMWQESQSKVWNKEQTYLFKKI